MYYPVYLNLHRTLAPAPQCVNSYCMKTRDTVSLDYQINALLVKRHRMSGTHEM